QIRGFAELEFIAKTENIVLVGKTGVGKTGLACSLLLKALENGYRCQFVRAQDLFDEMYASLADRSTRQLLKRLARLDLLLIDQRDILRLGDELQLRKPANLFAVHAWLAGEGKRLQRPALGQIGARDAPFQRAFLLRLPLRTYQARDE